MAEPRLVKGEFLRSISAADELGRLRRQRCEACLEELRARWQQYTVGFDPVRDPNRNVLARLIDACERLDRYAAEVLPAADRRETFLPQLLELAKDLERVAKSRYQRGRIAIQDFAQVTTFRLTAEIELHQARAK